MIEPKVRRALPVALLAFVLLLAAVAGARWLRGSGEDAFGPTDPSTTYGVSLEKQETDFTMGAFYIQRPGVTLTVLEVTPLVSPNVEFLGAFTVWPRDVPGSALSIGSGFPPKEMTVRHGLADVVPATETGFVPKGDPGTPAPLTVAVGFRIRSGSMGAVNGIQVVYKAGNRTVRQVFNQAAFVCIKPLRCTPPKGLSTSEWENQILRQFGLLPEGP